MYEEDREYYPEEETYARTYEVVVRLVVLAETSEEAEEAVHEVIDKLPLTLENVLQSKDILEFLRDQGLTSEVVVIANKQDLTGALQPSLVQRLLGVKSFGLTAIDPNDREKALDIIRLSLEKTIDWAKMEIDAVEFLP